MLGPILFLIFINYLPDNINSTFYLFNDERAFYRNIRRFEFFLCFRFDALTELGAFMRTEFLCISVLRVASGPRVKLDSCKSALNPPVVCSTDRSKAVSLTLCCFVVYSTRRFVVCLSVCHFVLVFFSPFRLRRLGKRELILVLFVRLFGLCLLRFVGFLFLLGSGKGYGL